MTCLDYRGRIGEDCPDLEYIFELNPIVLDCGQGCEGITCKDGTKNDYLDINTERYIPYCMVLFMDSQ